VRHICRCACLALSWLLLTSGLAAQDDVLAAARRAATSGRREAALSALEARLAVTPGDVDARLLYGLVLSWERRYDEARAALQQVLSEAPQYTDARVALMNVEYWSGRPTDARDLAEHILADHPGNAAARAIYDRIEASSQPWRGTTRYWFDNFTDSGSYGHEFEVSLTRRTPVGPLIVRGAQALRSGMDDELLEAEFYPRFRPGTYAFVAAGVATDASLYPRYRFGLELYQTLGRGFEVSAGTRYLAFDEPARIFVGSLAKYIQHWMLTGRVSYIPGGAGPDSTSYSARARRYFGRDGSNFIGISYTHGFSREEIRSAADLAALNSDAVGAEFDALLGQRVRVFASAGVGRQERADVPPRSQVTIMGGTSLKF
jgi:YaiO family outer membrane protein